jgi:two-component system response regulator YesN
MTGIELAEKIHLRHPDTQILLVSGYAEFSYAREAIRFSVLDYLLKPIDDDKFIQCIRKALSHIVNRRSKAFVEELEASLYQEVFSYHNMSVPLQTADTVHSNHTISMAVLLIEENKGGTAGDEILQHLIDILEAACNETYDTGFFRNKIKPNEIVLAAWGQCRKEALERLQRILLELKNRIDTDFIGSVSIGASGGETGCESASYLYKCCQDVLKQDLKIDGSIEAFFYRKSAPSNITEVVSKICDYIKTEYRYDISLAELADKYGLNSNYLSEIFKEKTGCNFRDYLTETRLKTARELLLTTNMSIKDIAFAVGYNSQGYFQRVFKNKYDVTPMDFREAYRDDK